MRQNKTAYSFGDSPFFKQQMDIKKIILKKSMTYLSVVVKMEREHETREHIHERESMAVFSLRWQSTLLIAFRGDI